VRVRVEAAIAQLPTAGTTAARVKSFSDPWGLESKRVATPRPDAEMEGAVAAATDRSRSFLNRSGNHWYTPRGTSGDVKFATSYARDWGMPFFKRRIEAPMQSYMVSGG